MCGWHLALCVILIARAIRQQRSSVRSPYKNCLICKYFFSRPLTRSAEMAASWFMQIHCRLLPIVTEVGWIAPVRLCRQTAVLGEGFIETEVGQQFAYNIFFELLLCFFLSHENEAAASVSARDFCIRTITSSPAT